MIAPHSPTSTLSSGPLRACSNQPGAKCLGEERGGSHRGCWCAQATSICAWQRRKWRQEITVTLHSGCRAGNRQAGGGGWGSGEALIIN